MFQQETCSCVRTLRESRKVCLELRLDASDLCLNLTRVHGEVQCEWARCCCTGPTSLLRRLTTNDRCGHGGSSRCTAAGGTGMCGHCDDWIRSPCVKGWECVECGGESVSERVCVECSGVSVYERVCVRVCVRDGARGMRKSVIGVCAHASCERCVIVAVDMTWQRKQ
jgi:hypothetical protein